MSKLIMKFFLFVILLVPVSLIVSRQDALASFPEADQLWIELGSEIKCASGAVIRTAYINYGIFPDKKINIAELEKLEAEYTFGQKNKENEDIFYKLDIKMSDSKPCFNILSDAINWCMVLVSGMRLENGIQYHYTAKSTFFLFGENRTEKNEFPVLRGAVNEVIDIQVYRERYREDFIFNREKPFPIRMNIAIKNKPFTGEAKIITGPGEVEKFITNKKGSFLYFPKKRGEENAFEQDLVKVESKINNKYYIATYTIPFGLNHSFINREYNIKLGIGIFFVFLIIFYIFALFKRKKFHNNL